MAICHLKMCLKAFDGEADIELNDRKYARVPVVGDYVVSHYDDDVSHDYHVISVELHPESDECLAHAYVYLQHDCDADLYSNYDRDEFDGALRPVRLNELIESFEYFGWTVSGRRTVWRNGDWRDLYEALLMSCLDEEL